MAGHAVAELEIRRSRFICAVWPAADRGEAEARIREWSDRHARATHNVFALRVGVAGLVEGCSDDGEPAGTAGRPALGVLQRLDLRNVALVVTRYFGGVKLGTGGLVRAYAEAARAGVEAAGIVTVVPGVRARLVVPFALWERALHTLRQQEGRVEAVAYGTDAVEATVWLPAGREGRFAAFLAGASAGRARWEPLGEAWAPPGPGTRPEGAASGPEAL